MPSLKSFVSALALAYLANAKTIKITATSDNTFDPSTVKASDGDILEFVFEPKNHSVVAGDYRGEADKVFRVEVNGTDPIAFYSSQGNECASGMVGIVNPSANQTLADYKKRASALARSVTPGRKPYGGDIADNDSSDDDDGDDDSKDGSSSSGGKSGSDDSGDSSSDKDGKDSGSVSL
ncbi:hypothetical protein TgHK011_004098 [Trichoderma gracile]|nr:hypothetical protein TgHK011_004098 [Trichoderma gracile]